MYIYIYKNTLDGDSPHQFPFFSGCFLEHLQDFTQTIHPEAVRFLLTGCCESDVHRPTIVYITPTIYKYICIISIDIYYTYMGNIWKHTYIYNVQCIVYICIYICI